MTAAPDEMVPLAPAAAGLGQAAPAGPGRTDGRARMHGALQRALGHGAQAGAYLCIGIENLAAIHAACGRASADAVVAGIGERILGAVTGGDLVAPIGDDQFGALLVGGDGEEPRAVAQRVLWLVREQPIEAPGGAISATVAVGIVLLAPPLETADEVMTRAEAAMRAARLHARDRIVQYRVQKTRRQERRRDENMSERIRSALDDDKLLFAFQPVVDVVEGQVSFYESLLRLRKDDGGIVAAGAFMPLVEREGLAGAVDRRALKLVLSELTAHPTVRLAVNVSGFTANDPSWLGALLDELQNAPTLAERLIIEITETAAIVDMRDIARFVDTVRGVGCRVALDDFGAGHTSFQHLERLAIDIVKIDGSFIRDLSRNLHQRRFVRSLVDLAARLGLAMVAECVESAADAAILRAEGVRYLQGYHFGRPALERGWLQAAAPAAAPTRLAPVVRVVRGQGRTGAQPR